MRQAPFPYLKLYVADYLADTQALSAEEHGAYLLLLFAMWREGGTLPDDPAVLARIAKVSVRTWKSRIGWRLQPYFIRAGGVLMQKRLTLELGRARQANEEHKSLGRRGGLERARRAGVP